MGMNAYASICFGIALEDGVELPWNDEKYRDGIEEWWRDVNNFVSPVPCPFDPRGNYLPGFGSDHPQVNDYFDAVHVWDKANPLPVEIVDFCSCEYPMYIIAVLGSQSYTDWGDPSPIDPTKLTVTPKEIAVLLDFLDEYGIETFFRSTSLFGRLRAAGRFGENPNCWAHQKQNTRSEERGRGF